MTEKLSRIPESELENRWSSGKRWDCGAGLSNSWFTSPCENFVCHPENAFTAEYAESAELNKLQVPFACSAFRAMNALTLSAAHANVFESHGAQSDGVQ